MNAQCDEAQTFKYLGESSQVFVRADIEVGVEVLDGGVHGISVCGVEVFV
jgi:hypothetical protein